MKKVFIFLLLLITPIILVPCDEEDLGLPFYESGAEIVRHTDFVLKYSEKHEQAEWVAYQLTLSEVEAEDYQRTDDFREDSAVSTGSATLDDYRGSGFDRGHLAPAEDFEWSAEAMSESFCMINMSPQKPGFNRGSGQISINVVGKLDRTILIDRDLESILLQYPGDSMGK